MKTVYSFYALNMVIRLQIDLFASKSLFGISARHVRITDAHGYRQLTYLASFASKEPRICGDTSYTDIRACGMRCGNALRRSLCIKS